MLLVFCAHTLFPVQLRTELAALDWAGIGLTLVAIVVVIAQMKRNAIIARMSSATSPERTTSDWDVWCDC